MATMHNDKTDGIFGERDHSAAPPHPKHPEPPLAGLFGEHARVKPPLAPELDEDDARDER